MKKEEITTITDFINKILECSESIIKNIYKNQKNKTQAVSNIIFPKYSNREDTKNDKTDSDGILRVSEEELKQVFIEQLLNKIKGTGWHYSVETPTHFRYKSPKSEDGPCITNKKENPSSKSGRIDLTIHDSNENPIAFIEFKYRSLSGKKEKDLLFDVIKLIAESQYEQTQNNNHCVGYSIHLIENQRQETTNFQSYITKARDIINETSPDFKVEADSQELSETIMYRTCKLFDEDK